VLQQVLTGLGVNAEQFAPCCVLVDKLEKQPLDALRGDFHALGVSDECLEALVKVRGDDRRKQNESDRWIFSDEGTGRLC
jgi:hypothetical protein